MQGRGWAPRRYSSAGLAAPPGRTRPALDLATGQRPAWVSLNGVSRPAAGSCRVTNLSPETAQLNRILTQIALLSELLEILGQGNRSRNEKVLGLLEATPRQPRLTARHHHPPGGAGLRHYPTRCGGHHARRQPPRRHRPPDDTNGPARLVSILRVGPYLIASIHAALDDGHLTRFQHDLVEQTAGSLADGVIIDLAAIDVPDSFATAHPGTWP